METVLIENPILNAPFEEPRRHFRFTEHGISSEINETRRPSSYFLPRTRSKRRNKHSTYAIGWSQDCLRENDFVNQVRSRVALLRQGSFRNFLTPTTTYLLDYWQRPQREQRLFFCQREAIETAIYITEVAGRNGDAWIDNHLRDCQAKANPALFRLAFKMATGTGKTVVMAMLLAWQALNKLANPQDSRFTNAFLIVTPGITIRDRLRVLLPGERHNYYREHDLVPRALLAELSKAAILITNFHAFRAREKLAAGALTRRILAGGATSPFLETVDQIARRVCRGLGSKKDLVVINDEGHHCYRPNPGEATPGLEPARLWISGLEAVQQKLGIRAVYDFSATPFFLRGCGYPEGTLFPWVVADFALIDAIEAGLVKVPRVPIGSQASDRNLWCCVRDQLPKAGTRQRGRSEVAKLPHPLQEAVNQFYANYEKTYHQWNQNSDPHLSCPPPPVFLIVCSDTKVSRLVYDYVAGRELTRPDGSSTLIPGQCALFSNVNEGCWSHRPNTILVDSEQLESGEGLHGDFKKIAAIQIEEFRADHRSRFPGRGGNTLTDADLLRELLNTVGKPGKLGEQIKCVVSVAMLNEGWDAKTVTHILGLRAFDSPLLSEQVVGRGLRRFSHALNSAGRFEPEYAEVCGVPFTFLPCAGADSSPRPIVKPTRIHALPDRSSCEIVFPRLVGYWRDQPAEQLLASFTADSHLRLPITGVTEDLKARRPQEVEFRLAKLLLSRWCQRTACPGAQPWLFPQMLRICRQWLTACCARPG